MTRGLSSGTTLQPNLRASISGVAFPIKGNIHVLTSCFLERLFPKKTWAGVASLFKVSERVAKRRLANDRGYSAEEILILIFSKYGARYIEWMARNIDESSHQEWLRIHLPLMEMADAQKLQLAARTKTAKILRRAVHEDNELTAAIRRAETIAIHDSEFHGAHGDALREIARVSDRAMAPKVGRK